MGDTRLQELVTAIHATLNDASVAARVGRVYLDEHDQARRVVWVREGGDVEPPKQAGGRLVPGATPDDPDFRVRACKIRVERVQAHIYAEEEDLAENLLDAIIAAVCLTVPTVRMTGYDWVTEEAEHAGRTLRTSKVVLKMQGFRLPVPDEIRQLEPVQAVDHVCGTLDANGDVVPQD
jgi:hypothetical protein